MTESVTSSEFNAIFAFERATIRTPNGEPIDVDRPLTGWCFFRRWPVSAHLRESAGLPPELQAGAADLAAAQSS